MTKNIAFVISSLAVFAFLTWRAELNERVGQDLPLATQPSLQVSPDSASSPFGVEIESSTQPSSGFASVTVSANTPIPSDPEAIINSTGYWVNVSGIQFASTGTGTYSSDAVPQGTSVTVSPVSSSTQPSGTPTFTLTGIFPAPGYYEIALTGGATFTDTDQNTYSGSNSTTVYVLAYHVDLLWASNDPVYTTDGSELGITDSVKGAQLKGLLGEGIDIYAVVQPSDLSVSGWTIDGHDPDPVTGFTAGTPSDPGVGEVEAWNERQGDPPETTREAHYYYSLTATSSVTFTTRLPSGTDLDATTHFDIYPPSFDPDVSTASFQPATSFNNFRLNAATLTPVNNPWLYYGLDSSVTTTNGSTAPYGDEIPVVAHDPLEVQAPSPPTQQWVQVETQQDQGWQYSAGWSSFYPSSGLDTQYPYCAGNPYWARDLLLFCYADAPGIQAYVADPNDASIKSIAVYSHCEFDTYLDYKPGFQDSIFVPVYTWHWHYGGNATYNGVGDPLNQSSWNTGTSLFGGLTSSGIPTAWYSWQDIAGNNAAQVGP